MFRSVLSRAHAAHICSLPLGLLAIGCALSACALNVSAAEVNISDADILRFKATNSAAVNSVSADAVAAEKRHATAVSDAALQTPKSNFAEKLLDSPAFAAQVQQQQSSNAQALKAADPTVIDSIRSKLPRFKDTGNQLKFGRHVTISGDGDETIELIRKAASTSSAQVRIPLLARIQSLAQNRVPEALNILGFLIETGSLGATRDLQKAAQYYKASASAGYQPAVYNLALLAAYGRLGPPDFSAALMQLDKANAIGPEDSYRVCGMASFIAFRQGQLQAAARYGAGCGSSLTHLSKATSDTKFETLHKRVELLRDSLATGANDAFPLLATITQAHAKNDPDQLYCKYMLVNLFRDKTDLKPVRSLADRCLSPSEDATTGSPKPNTLGRSQMVSGVAGFVPVELDHIKKMRQSNRFHYSWSVPYLPFGQQEVDIFERVIPKSPQ